MPHNNNVLGQNDDDTLAGAFCAPKLLECGWVRELPFVSMHRAVTVSAATVGSSPHKQAMSEWYTFDVVVHQDDEAEIQAGVQETLIQAGVDQLVREPKVAFVRHTSLRLRELYLVGRFASEQEAEPALDTEYARALKRLHT